MNPTLDVNDFVLAFAHLLALQHRFTDLRLDVFYATQELKISHVQVRGSVDQVGRVKVVDVVAGDDVRVDLSHELGPSFQKQGFLVTGYHIRSNDWRACVQGEDVPDEWLRVTLKKIVF